MKRLGLVLLLAATPGSAQDSAQGSIEQRLDRQEAELLDLRQELEALRAASPAGRSGFEWVSDDGASELKIGGRFEVHTVVFEPGVERRDEVRLRKMRLEIEGRFDERWRFMLEPKFTEDGAGLDEAWVGHEFPGGPLVILGRMKEPFSLEEVRSSKGLEFVNKSIVNQFAPAEDHGLTVLGDLGGGAFEWGAAVYHGSGGEEVNRDQDVAGRLVWHPFHGSAGNLEALQIGVAATRGEADEDLAGEELQTEARVPFLVYGPGAMVDGSRDRLGLEFEWHRGPLALAAELVRIEEDVVGAGGSGEVAHQAVYVQATWVLTGEERTWKGVVPARPFGSPGGWGAWQLALRYSELDLDSDLVGHGLVAANEFPDRVPSIDLGLNWYATKHARMKLHALHTMYSDAITIDGDRGDSETTLLLQFELRF